MYVFNSQNCTVRLSLSREIPRVRTVGNLKSNVYVHLYKSASLCCQCVCARDTGQLQRCKPKKCILLTLRTHIVLSDGMLLELKMSTIYFLVPVCCISLSVIARYYSVTFLTLNRKVLTPQDS